MEMFWDVRSHRLVNSYLHFGGAYCLHLQDQAVREDCGEKTRLGLLDFEERSTTVLRKDGNYLPVDTAQLSRRLESSSTPLSEP